MWLQEQHTYFLVGFVAFPSLFKTVVLQWVFLVDGVFLLAVQVSQIIIDAVGNWWTEQKGAFWLHKQGY